MDLGCSVRGLPSAIRIGVIGIFPDLPLPPPGRSGWPWTTADQPDLSGRLRVTVVTPSFNQAEYLEATIRSVLLQSHRQIEFLLIDGGSTDGSRELIARYAAHMDYWVSEPDRGQAHAINKGFERATGEILGWINSDDYYTPGAVARIVAEFEADPSLEWIYGDCFMRTEPGGNLSLRPSEPFVFPAALRGHSPIWQPSAFFRRSLLDATGGLDETFRLAMDYDLWLRAIKHTSPLYLSGPPLAVITDHAQTKSRRQLGEVVFESTRAVECFYAGRTVPGDALHARRRVMGHLYFECAAAAVLWRKSVWQGARWFLRAAAQDPRVLFRIPVLSVQLAALLVARQIELSASRQRTR